MAPRCATGNLSFATRLSLPAVRERRCRSRADIMSTPAVTHALSSHLKRLEAESIGIIREVAAEFRNPVLLYSIGKDSGVLLHLAMKAFYPSKPPFPLLHVDTGWKFRDMIRHRDSIASSYGIKLLVYTNPDGLARGINPITSGSQLH